MSTMEWVPCPSPSDLTSSECQTVLDLFWNETGEVYSETTVRLLPVPAWSGNMMLVNKEHEQPVIEGVLWATPFKDDIVRIAAFVLHRRHQGKGWGTLAWERFVKTMVDEGYGQVQLEVKAANHRAQAFYQQRGMSIQRELVGYYASGLGYMMRGPLRA